MNPRIARLRGEADKTKQKIADLQAKLRDQEQQITELENAEIVAAVRGTRAKPEEFDALLESLRAAMFPGEAAPQPQPPAPAPGPSAYQPNKEDTVNEE